MQEFLLHINNDFLSEEALKIIVFIWNVFKCIFLFLISIKLSKWFLNKIFNQITKRLDETERIQQIITLKTISTHILEAFIFVVFVINILFLFGIDIRPLLATAGVLGVAIGFGAKRFVEDIITGFIILIEGQIRVGDYVEVGNVAGFVEKITLPLVTIRSDKDGSLCFVRCGYIDTVINHTINYAYATLYFDVAYKENLDNVFRLIKVAFEKLKQNDELKDKILSDIEIFGLDELKESSLSVKCRIKTQPKGQWIIKREFNKIVKEEFDKNNIEIPFNQIVVNKSN